MAHLSKKADFRTLQACFDLQSAARHLIDKVPNGPQERVLQEWFEPQKTGRLVQWVPELSDAAWAYWALAAASPENGAERHLLGTCIVLIGALVTANPIWDVNGEWETFAERYRAAPAPVRAAIMTGIWRICDCEGLATHDKITSADRRTQARADVLAPLVHLARSMSAEDRRHVAECDYGMDVDRHLAALNVLLTSEGCRFPRDAVWFPQEVVELASHVPFTPGFSGCLALILIDAIHGEDIRGGSEFRWRNLSANLDQLPPSERKAIFAGFRHLYETQQDWDPFDDQVAPDRLPVYNFIPWVSSEA